MHPLSKDNAGNTYGQYISKDKLQGMSIFRAYTNGLFLSMMYLMHMFVKERCVQESMTSRKPHIFQQKDKAILPEEGPAGRQVLYFKRVHYLVVICDQTDQQNTRHCDKIVKHNYLESILD